MGTTQRSEKLRRSSQDCETSSTTVAISGCSIFKEYRRKHFIRVKVLNMLSSSQSDSKSTTSSNEDDNKNLKAFKSTRRTGRRNALPDIRDSHAETSISDVPDRFGDLSTKADRKMNDAEQVPNQPNM